MLNKIQNIIKPESWGIVDAISRKIYPKSWEVANLEPICHKLYISTGIWPKASLKHMWLFIYIQRFKGIKAVYGRIR